MEQHESSTDLPHDDHSAASVYAQIRARVLHHEIPPNTRINIDGLARELQVSPTPVREALKQLQGDNLVLQTPGRGYSTTPVLELDELRDLFEFRLLIEPWAARIAAQDRLSNPGHELAAQVQALKKVMSDAQDARYEIMNHDINFHDTILRSSKNEVLRGAFAQTHCHLHAFRLNTSDFTGERTISEHIAVLEAIQERDPAAAEAAMRNHLTTAFLRFEKGYAEGGEFRPRGPAILPGTHPERPLPQAKLAI